MKRQLIPATLGALALTVSVAAQTQPPASKPQLPPPAAAVSAPVTVEGCLMREDDVPGRKANVAERVGVANDFILTSTKMVKGTAPGGAANRGAEAVGTSGSGGEMYDVNGIDEETMKRLLNQRVEVDGTFQNLDRGVKGTALIEIKATAIRPAQGECPKP